MPMQADTPIDRDGNAGGLRIRSLGYRYHLERLDQEYVALDNVTLDVQPNEFACLVGPSGCGKSTLLNIVAGLLRASIGTIRLDGVDIEGPDVDRAMVFQHASLLPWRTVRGNVRYGMEMQSRLPPGEMDSRVARFVEMVGLSGCEGRYPAELSGGMQQRVNLARALATDPTMLLMDEPFAALDAQTRELMQAELLKIWTTTRKTVVFVTHQIDEAVFLSDRVVVMGTRPGHVKRVFEVPFGRPRPLSLKRNPDFMALCDRVWSMIEEEAIQAGTS